MGASSTLRADGHRRRRPRRLPGRDRPRAGVGLAFAFAPVTAKLAYQDDVQVATLLTLRFVFTALLFWIVVAMLRRPLPRRRGVVRAV